ncbi:MAG: hypothetical protein QOJ34_1419 [Pseudonocardiales bacterium]|jgi:hypothetical protein|nr:hypothetical protein [Pseudonocardiales bacterium]
MRALTRATHQPCVGERSPTTAEDQYDQMYEGPSGVSTTA